MMNPVFVEDWKMIKERWKAFWDFDYIDRPVLQIMAPKRERKIDPILEEEHNDPIKKHADYNHIFKYGLYTMENTRYIAEAIPVMTPGSSVGHALYFGCKPIFDKFSVV
ncbi:MAG TPA: hypothetical protein GXX14_03885 [Clostridiaceae bacterium]|nr:hypothetical protein [Clostridiaceae bacterium]